jgi:thymidylate synthase (FAD)
MFKLKKIIIKKLNKLIDKSIRDVFNYVTIVEDEELGKTFKVDKEEKKEEGAVSLIAITPKAEELVAYCARVSSSDQFNPNISKLLTYCIDHGHWSVFETPYITIEINTSRAISAQILRHRSFTFQEFSQRYSAVADFEMYPARRQDSKNRQNSIDDMSSKDRTWFWNAQDAVKDVCSSLYEDALERGIAKEQARFLLPLSSKTKIYMTGNVRSWIHYLDLRCRVDTQKEHRDIALAIREILKKELPIISKAVAWV